MFAEQAEGAQGLVSERTEMFSVWGRCCTRSWRVGRSIWLTRWNEVLESARGGRMPPPMRPGAFRYRTHFCQIVRKALASIRGIATRACSNSSARSKGSLQGE